MLRRVVTSLIYCFLSRVYAVNALSVNSYRDEKSDEMRKIQSLFGRSKGRYCCCKSCYRIGMVRNHTFVSRLADIEVLNN